MFFLGVLFFENPLPVLPLKLHVTPLPLNLHLVAVRTLENFANWGRTIDTITTSAIISESQYYDGHNPSDVSVTIPARARPRPPVARGGGKAPPCTRLLF